MGGNHDLLVSPRLTWGLWHPFPNGRTYFMGPRPSLLTSSWGHVILQGIAAASLTTPPASPTENYRWSPLPQVGLGEAPMSKELCTFPKKAAELTLHFSDFFVLVDRCVSANLPNLWSQWVSSSFWGIHLFHLWVIIWIFTTWSLQPHNFWNHQKQGVLQ